MGSFPHEFPLRYHPCPPPTSHSSTIRGVSRPGLVRNKLLDAVNHGRMVKKGGSAVTRIDGVDPDHAQGPMKAIFEAQINKWGAPLLNHLLYARRPTIFRGVRAMWTGLDSSGLIDGKLLSLINRRVAAINGCEF